MAHNTQTEGETFPGLMQILVIRDTEYPFFKETYSHVIAAVAGPEAARSTIRLTLAPDMSKSDVDKLIESLRIPIRDTEYPFFTNHIF